MKKLLLLMFAVTAAFAVDKVQPVKSVDVKVSEGKTNEVKSAALVSSVTPESNVITAVPTPVKNEGLETKTYTVGGYFLAEDRCNVNNGATLYWQEYRLALNGEVKLENTHLYSEVWLRGWGTNSVFSSVDAKSIDNVLTYDVALREAYVDLYSVFTKGFDVRAGRQRIAWGTGDKINPTDNIDADDLEDIWDFGRHLASDALKITYAAGPITLTGVWVPLFRPAVLPRNDISFSSALSLPTDPVTISSITDIIVQPELKALESSSVAVKVAAQLFSFDISASYYYGRDDLPMQTNVTLFSTNLEPILVGMTFAGLTGSSDVKAYLTYPRIQVAGFDVSGELFGIGLRGEAGVFIPQEVKLTTVMDVHFTNAMYDPYLPLIGFTNQESVLLKNEAYVKYVIGADYTFPCNVYANLQYVHGMPYERGRENLEDYFVLRIEWTAIENVLKITPIEGALEIKKFDDFTNNYGFVYSPSVTWYPFDGAEVTMGGRFIDGTATTLFGRVKNNDEVYARLKYSF